MKINNREYITSVRTKKARKHKKHVATKNSNTNSRYSIRPKAKFNWIPILILVLLIEAFAIGYILGHIIPEIAYRNNHDDASFVTETKESPSTNQNINTEVQSTEKNQTTVNVSTADDVSNEQSMEYDDSADYYEGEFELPLVGATGWASVKMNFRKEPNLESEILYQMAPGTSFTILEECGDWFKVVTKDDEKGYLFSDLILINLPDIITTIVYEDTNSCKSIFKSSGVELQGITNESLYDVYNYNARFDCDKYDMPVLYGMASKIMKAQKTAMEKGYSLKIYETYRPSEVQLNVADALTGLRKSNSVVAQGLNSNVWSLNWFIATKVSNHQRGIAMDTSLVKVNQVEERVSGIYKYSIVSDYTELEMPTPMHELSTAAARYKSPTSSEFAASMNENAILLHSICTSAGLEPLQSEWWHFNDNETSKSVSVKSDGYYYLQPNLSAAVES